MVTKMKPYKNLNLKRYRGTFGAQSTVALAKFAQRQYVPGSENVTYHLRTHTYANYLLGHGQAHL